SPHQRSLRQRNLPRLRQPKQQQRPGHRRHPTERDRPPQPRRLRHHPHDLQPHHAPRRPRHPRQRLRRSPRPRRKHLRRPGPKHRRRSTGKSTPEHIPHQKPSGGGNKPQTGRHSRGQGQDHRGPPPPK